MTIYVNQAALTEGDGSQERPFKHINDAARVAKPGDEVIVAKGVTESTLTRFAAAPRTRE